MSKRSIKASLKLKIICSVLTVFTVFVIGSGATLAQDNGTVGIFANAIDRSASAYGFSNGDGVIQPVEQNVATALANEVATHSYYLETVSQSNTEYMEWLNHADQQASNFNQTTGETGLNAPLDTRAQILVDVIDEYVNSVDAETDIAAQPLDTRAQILVDVIDQYVNSDDAETDLAQQPLDTRAQILVDVIDQYVNSDDAETDLAQQPLDARAQILVDVIDEYVNSVDAEADLARRSLLEASMEAIYGTDVQHPNLVRRRIQNLILWEVETSMLPTNGRWRIQPFTMQEEGQCITDGGDNGGMAPIGEDQDPGEPLCGYRNPGGTPFITWLGGSYPYLDGTGSIYSEVPTVRYEPVRNSSGATIGSVRWTSQTEYRVLSPTLIEVTILEQEDGGCTRSATFYIELVTADESVCPVGLTLGEVPIPVSTPNPNATPAPVTPEPEEEDPQVITSSGMYLASPVQYTDELACDANNRPPEFSEVSVTEQEDGSLLIDFGSTTRTVYTLGDGFYEFNNGTSSFPRETIYVNLFGDGTGNIAWSSRAADGRICYAMIDINLPGAEPAAFVPEPTEGPISAELPVMESFEVLSGSYSVTWSQVPGMECPEALLPTAPNFTQVTISQVDGGYLLDTDIEDYVLGTEYGLPMFMDYRDDGSGATVSIAQVVDGGVIEGSYSGFEANGDYCLMIFRFTP